MKTPWQVALYSPETGGGEVAAPVSVESSTPAVAPPSAVVEAVAVSSPPAETATAAPSEPLVPVSEKIIETKPAEPVKNDFASSLLEEGAKPATEVKPTDPKAPDAKTEAPAVAEPAAEVVVPKYEFQFPEGVKPEDLNSERMGAYTGILGEAKVAPEVGQKLLDLHLKEVSEATARLSQNQWDVFNRQQEAWKQEVKSDPEIGGSRFQTAIRTCASVIEQYGGPPEQQKALWDVFKMTGAGNNPVVIKFLHNIGKSLAVEGSPVPAPPPRAPSMSREQRGRARYTGG